MTAPDGNVILPTGKALDVEFGQTSKWDGDDPDRGSLSVPQLREETIGVA